MPASPRKLSTWISPKLTWSNLQEKGVGRLRCSEASTLPAPAPPEFSGPPSTPPGLPSELRAFQGKTEREREPFSPFLRAAAR